MKRHLTAGIVSIGLIFAAGTQKPAQAGSEEVALIVTSAIAVFALTEMFKDDDKDKKKSTNVSRRNPPYYSVPPRHNGKKGSKYWRVNRVVPGQCFYRYSDRGRMQGVFGQQCMNSIMGSTKHLPNSCRRDKGRQFSRAPVYDAGCLRSRGYRVEARLR